MLQDLQAWASGQTSLEAMPSKERAVTACVNRILCTQQLAEQQLVPDSHNS